MALEWSLRSGSFAMLEMHFEEENRLIGAVLREARLRRGVSVMRCAELLHTNRRRYNHIEAGTAVVSVPELRLLITFLDIPDNELWHAYPSSPSSPLRSGAASVTVKVQPGTEVQVIVDHSAPSHQSVEAVPTIV